MVSSAGFNNGPDLIVAMVTSSVRRMANRGTGDVVLADWRLAGLLRPSVVRSGRLMVLEARLLSAQIGTLTQADLAEVDRGLKDALGLV